MKAYLKNPSLDLSILENKELCQKCGGICCKKSGCNYLPADFPDLLFDSLKAKIDEGKISISATFEINQNRNMKFEVKPLLHLRARNRKRGVVDLFSRKTRCSVLTETGCPYTIEERPSCGVLLIANEEGCFSLYPEEMSVKDWQAHQNVLTKLVEHYCGHSLQKELAIQIENTAVQVIEELKSSNGNTATMDSEGKALLTTIHYLKQCKEYSTAVQNAQKKVLAK